MVETRDFLWTTSESLSIPAIGGKERSQEHSGPTCIAYPHGRSWNSKSPKRDYMARIQDCIST